MDAKFKEWRERGIRCDRGNNFAMVFEAETAKGDGAPCTPGLQPVRLRDSFPSAIESTRVCTCEIMIRFWIVCILKWKGNTKSE
jgi:hypothetical protein